MTAERSTLIAKRPTPNCRECNAGKIPAPRPALPTPPASPFIAQYERDPRTPEPPTWDGRRDPLPEPQYMPVFKNYQFRYGAYPGFRDCSKKPLWPDGAVAEHDRRQESPVKGITGRKGRTTFKRTERVCGDLQFARQPTVSKLLPPSASIFALMATECQASSARRLDCLIKFKTAKNCVCVANLSTEVCVKRTSKKIAFQG